MTTLNFNEVRLMGTIDRMGDLKQPSYSLIEIILNVENLVRNTKTQKWENVSKKIAVVFFGKPAEEIALLHFGTEIYISGEVNTRFTVRNGVEYANTSVQGKKYQVINRNASPSSSKKEAPSSQVTIDDFDTDIPF